MAIKKILFIFPKKFNAQQFHVQELMHKYTCMCIQELSVKISVVKFIFSKFLDITYRQVVLFSYFSLTFSVSHFCSSYWLFFVLPHRNGKYSGHYGELPKRKRNFGSGAERHCSENDHRGWHPSCTGVHQWSVCGICGHRLHHHDDYLISLADFLLYTAFPIYWLTIWKSGNYG